MIEIIKELDVEVTKPNIFQAIVAKQYDMNTRFLKVTLKDCGTRIDVPNIETAKVVINAERKDGQSKGFDGVVNDDGTVTVPLHSWMLELDGTVICDISVIDTATDDNKKLTTTSFTLMVEKAAYGGDDVTNDPQYDVLVQLLEGCSAASELAEEALTKSNLALEKSAEADSKYEACVRATQDANAVREEIEEGGYIESLKERNNGGKFSFWVGTQAEYDAIPEISNNCFYIITDDKSKEEIEQSIEDIIERLTKLENKEQILFEADIETGPITNDTTALITIPDLHKYSMVKIFGGGDGTTTCLCSVENYEDDSTENFIALRGTTNDGIYCDETTISLYQVNIQLTFQFNGQTSMLSQIRSYVYNFQSDAPGELQNFSFYEFPIEKIVGIL